MAAIKTAVSIQKPVFVRVEQLCRRLKIPRSRLYNQALKEFMERNESKEILRRMNAACAAAESQDDVEFKRSMRGYLKRRLNKPW